jgi:hypothetical protein
MLVIQMESRGDVVKYTQNVADPRLNRFIQLIKNTLNHSRIK